MRLLCLFLSGVSISSLGKIETKKHIRKFPKKTSHVFIDSFKNHDVYIAVLTAERKKWEACAHVEKADEKHPSEDVVPVEVMVDEPDGALILGQGKAT